MLPVRPKEGHGFVFIGYGVPPGTEEQGPEVWDHPDNIRVLTSVDKTQRKLEFHVSVSEYFLMPSDDAMRIFYDAFPMVKTWEEDNHGGRFRHFWKPLILDLTGECECKL